MRIHCHTGYLPFLCKALNYTPSPHAQCIVCADEEGKPVAGVIYDGFNGQTVHCHIWLDPERRPSKIWMAVIFDWPFNRLGAGKLIGQVRSSNLDARHLDEHFGFKLEAVVADYYDNHDALMVYTLTKGECVVLNSPRWQKTLSIVKRM